MATYSEEFLNALSRATSSITGLMEQVKEPDWKEKVRYETEMQIKVLKEQGDVETGHIYQKGDVSSQLSEQGHEQDVDKIGVTHGFDMEKLSKTMTHEEKITLLQHQYDMLQGEQQHDQALEQIIAHGDVSKEEAVLQNELNQDTQHLLHMLTKEQLGLQHGYTKELKGLDFTNETDMAAFKTVLQTQLLNTQADIALLNMHEEAKLAYQAAGYDTVVGLGDVDFMDIPMPEDTWMPLEKGIFGGGQSQMGMPEAKTAFETHLALYNMQIPGALKAKVVNPESFAVKEAIRDADMAIEQGLSLLDFAERKGFDDEEVYFEGAVKNLMAIKKRLEL